MELFFGVATAFIVEALKWIANKFGQQTTKLVIYLGVLVISGVWTYLKVTGILTEEFLQTIMQNIAVAIATYEVIIKWILKQGIMPETKVLLGKLKK